MNEITHFNTFIAGKHTGIPYSTQWMVHIDGIPDVVSSDLKDTDTQAWSIARNGAGIRQSADASNNLVAGNIFAQLVTVPGERLQVERPGIEHQYRGGFASAPILNTRHDNDLLTIDFLETRDSFIDLVIRPWVIQVGFRGLLPPKDPRNSIKSTLWAVFFDRGNPERPEESPVIRKKWIFHNAVPVAVDPDTVDYQKNNITILKTQWLYSHYTIEAANDRPGTTTPSSVTPQFGGFPSTPKEVNTKFGNFETIPTFGPSKI